VLAPLQDNLKKTIAYTLAHAVPEVWPLFLNLVLNFPLGECAGSAGAPRLMASLLAGDTRGASATRPVLC
jgi:hypothetical protein